jgi:hypothetical protein
MAFKSYQEIFGRREDFVIKYRYFTPEEGGRQQLPHQHIRNDFWYAHPDHEPNSVFMIYPEFRDAQGNIIEKGEVPREGFAHMWIVMPAMFQYHKTRLKVGQKGFFHEGARRTAECEIMDITGLHALSTT